MKFALLALVLISFSAKAITWEVIGPCSEKPVHEGAYAISNLEQSVGDTTVLIFDQNNVEYIGNAAGMNSILGSPTGSDAIEVLSDTEMRAYGWCYQVNGFEPAVLPHNYWFKSSEDHLTWIIGFAHYKDGQWLTYCTPAHTVAPDFLCK